MATSGDGASDKPGNAPGRMDGMTPKGDDMQPNEPEYTKRTMKRHRVDFATAVSVGKLDIRIANARCKLSGLTTRRRQLVGEW